MSGAKRDLLFHRRLRGEFLVRSEEHTSELQSQSNLVCRLLLEEIKHPAGDRNRYTGAKRLYAPNAGDTDFSFTAEDILVTLCKTLSQELPVHHPLVECSARYLE